MKKVNAKKIPPKNQKPHGAWNVKFVSIKTVWGFDELGVFYWSHYFPGPEVLEPGVWNCSQQRH